MSLLETLFIGLELQAQSFESSLQRQKINARNVGRDIEASLNLNIRPVTIVPSVDPIQLKRLQGTYTEVNNSHEKTRRGLAKICPQVDFSQLHELNELYRIKEADHNQLVNAVQTPITPKVNNKDLVDSINLYKELQSLNNLAGGSASATGSTISIKIQGVEQGLEKLPKEIGKEVKEALQDALKPGFFGTIGKALSAPVRGVTSVIGSAARGGIERAGANFIESAQSSLASTIPELQVLQTKALDGLIGGVRRRFVEELNSLKALTADQDIPGLVSNGLTALIKTSGALGLNLTEIEQIPALKKKAVELSTKLDQEISDRLNFISDAEAEIARAEQDLLTRFGSTDSDYILAKLVNLKSRVKGTSSESTAAEVIDQALGELDAIAEAKNIVESQTKSLDGLFATKKAIRGEAINPDQVEGVAQALSIITDDYTRGVQKAISDRIAAVEASANDSTERVKRLAKERQERVSLRGDRKDALLAVRDQISGLAKKRTELLKLIDNYSIIVQKFDQEDELINSKKEQYDQIVNALGALNAASEASPAKARENRSTTAALTNKAIKLSEEISSLEDKERIAARKKAEARLEQLKAEESGVKQALDERVKFGQSITRKTNPILARAAQVAGLDVEDIPSVDILPAESSALGAYSSRQNQIKLPQSIVKGLVVDGAIPSKAFETIVHEFNHALTTILNPDAIFDENASTLDAETIKKFQSLPADIRNKILDIASKYSTSVEDEINAYVNQRDDVGIHDILSKTNQSLVDHLKSLEYLSANTDLDVQPEDARKQLERLFKIDAETVNVRENTASVQRVDIDANAVKLKQASAKLSASDLTGIADPWLDITNSIQSTIESIEAIADAVDDQVDSVSPDEFASEIPLIEFDQALADRQAAEFEKAIAEWSEKKDELVEVAISDFNQLTEKLIAMEAELSDGSAELVQARPHDNSGQLAVSADSNNLVQSGRSAASSLASQGAAMVHSAINPTLQKVSKTINTALEHVSDAVSPTITRAAEDLAIVKSTVAPIVQPVIDAASPAMDRLASELEKVILEAYNERAVVSRDGVVDPSQIAASVSDIDYRQIAKIVIEDIQATGEITVESAKKVAKTLAALPGAEHVANFGIEFLGAIGGTVKGLKELESGLFDIVGFLKPIKGFLKTFVVPKLAIEGAKLAFPAIAPGIAAAEHFVGQQATHLLPQAASAIGGVVGDAGLHGIQAATVGALGSAAIATIEASAERIGESVAERAIVGAAEKAADVVLEKAADAKQSKQLNAQIDARVLDITEIQPRRINSVGQAQSAVRQRYDEYNQASESFKSGDLQRSHYLASNLGPSIKAAEAEIDSLIREALAAADKSLAEDLRTIKGQLKSNIERLSNKLLGKIVLQQDALRSDTEDLQSPLNEGDSTTDHKAKLRAEYEKVGQTIKDNGALAGEDAAIEFGILANSYIAGIRQNKAKLEQAGESSPEIKAYIAELNELARYAGQLRTNAAKKAGVDLPKLSISGDRHNAAVSGLLDGVTDKVESLIKAISNSVQKLNTQVREEGVKGAVKYAAGNPIIRDLAVNTAGFAASNLGAEHGVVASLAGDLGGALAARHALNTAIALYEAYKLVIAQTGDTSVKSASKLMKLQSVIVETGRLMNSPEYQRGLGEELFGDTVGFGIGNVAATGLNAVEAISGIPLKGAAVAMTTVPALSRVRNKFFVDQGEPESIGTDTVEGAATGIEQSIPEAEDAAIRLARSIIGTVKSILEIQSPSKVFIRIGQNIVAGLEAGLSDIPQLNDRLTGILSGIDVTDANTITDVTDEIVKRIESGQEDIEIQLDRFDAAISTKVASATSPGSDPSHTAAISNPETFLADTLSPESIIQSLFAPLLNQLAGIEQNKIESEQRQAQAEANRIKAQTDAVRNAEPLSESAAINRISEIERELASNSNSQSNSAPYVAPVADPLYADDVRRLEIENNVKQAQDHIQSFWSKFNENISKLVSSSITRVSAIAQQFNPFESVTTTLSDQVKAVSDSVSALQKESSAELSQLLSNLPSDSSELESKFSSIFEKIDNIISTIDTALPNQKDAAERIASLTNEFNERAEAILSVGGEDAVELVESLFHALQEEIAQIQQEVPDAEETTTTRLRLPPVLDRFRNQGEQPLQDAAISSGSGLLDGAKRAIENIKAEVPFLGSLLNVVQDIGSALFIGRVGAFLGNYIVQLGKESFQAALDLTRLKTALDFATVEGSTKVLAQVTEETNRLGTSFREAAIARQNLEAAATGTSLQPQIQGILTGFQQRFAAQQLAPEAQGGVLRQVGQIIGKSKLQAEDVLQAGENLPGFLQVLARSLGLTTAEVLKAGEAGNLLAEDVLPKLGNQLRLESNESAAAAANSASGEFTRLSNNLQRLKESAGAPVLGVFTQGLRLLNPLLNAVNQNMAQVQLVISALAISIAGRLVASIGSFVINLIGVNQVASAVFSGLVAGAKTLLVALAQQAAAAAALVVIYESLRAVTVGIENPIAKLAKTESDNLDNLIKKQKEYNDLKKGGVAQPKEKEFTTSNPILNFIDGANRAFQDLNKPLIERLREGDLTQKELLNKRFSENNTFAAREALQIKEDVATQLDKGSKTLDLLKLPSGDDLRKKIAEIQAFDDKLAVLRVKRSVAALEGQPQFKLEELDKESGKLNQERSERSNRLFASTRIALLAQEKRLNSTKEELDAVGYFPGKDQQIKEVEALIARNRKALEQSDQIAADIAEKTQTVAADLLKVNAIQDAQKIEFDNSTLKERTNLLEKQRDLLLTNATINNNNLRLEVDTAKANLKRLADSRAAYEAILSKLKSTDRAALTESLGGVDVSKASRSEVNRVKELSQANFIKGFTKDASDALDVRLKILDLTGEQTQASNALVQAQLNEKKGVDQLTDSLSKLTSRYESIDILAARARASFNLGLARSKASLTVGDIGAQEQSARRDIEDNTKLIAKLGESRKEYISELNKFTGADRREIEKVSGKRLEQLDTNDISQLNRDFPLSANQKKALEGRQQIIAITDRITQAQQTSAEASLTLTNLARSTYRNAVTLSRNLDDFKRGVEDFYTGLQKQIRDSITQYKKTLLAIEGIKTQTAFSQLQSGGTADLFAPLLGFIQDIQTQSNQLEQQRLDLANTPFDVAEQQRNLALQTRDLNRQFQDLSLELKLFQESLRGTSKGLFQNNAIKFDRKPIDPNTLQIKKNNALGIGGPTEDTPNIYNPNSAISAINRAAETLGVSAEDIATIIQTESSFRNIRGGSGNAYAGYLQFGRPALQDLQAQGSAKKGTDGLNYSFNEQLELFTKYALLRGYQPGAGVRSLYNTHNLGNPNATGSDGFGTPGGRTDKLNGDSLERQAARRMLSRLAQTGEQIGYSPLTPARIFAPVGGIPTPNFANQSTTANPNEIRGLFGRQDNVIVLPNASASVLQSIGVFGGVSVPGAQPQTPLPSSQDRPPLPGEVGGLFGNPYNRIALPGGVTPSIAQSLNVFGGLQGSAPSRVPDIQRPPLPGEIGGLFGDSRNRIALPGGITPSVAETIRAFGGTNNPPTPQLPTPQPVILPQLPPLSAQGSGVPFVPQLPPPPTATIGSLAPLPVPSLPRFGAGSQAALPPAPNLGSQSILADQIPLQQKSIELSGQAKDLINEIGRLATQNNELKRQEIEIQGRLNDAQNKQKLADLTRQQSRAFQDLNEEIARYGGQVKELNNQSRLPSFASGLAEQVKQVEGSYLDLIKTLTRKQEDLQINLNAANAFASGSLAEFIQLTGVPAEYATQAGEALLKQAPALESAIAKIKEQISSLSPDQAKDLVTRQFTQQTIGDINRVGQGIRQEGFQNQIASLNRRRDPYGAAAVQTQASLDSLSGEFASSTVNLTETLSRIPGLSDEARKALEDLRLAALDLNISPDEFQGFLSRIPADSQASIEAINLLTEAQANYQGKQSEVLATQQTLFGDLTRGAEDAAGSAFSNLLGNFGNLVTGVKSAGDAAREFFLTFLQGLAQVATQIATQQILKSLTGAFGGTGGGAPSVGLGGFGGLIGLFNAGGTVPNYAIGGSVDPMTIANYAGGGRLDSSVDATGLGMAMLQAMQRERAAGGNPVPVVASTGEEILSMKNGDAQAYRSLKQSGQWNNIKVGNYVDGTTPDRPRSGGNGSGRNNIVINENIYLQDASGVRQTEFQRRHKDGVLSRRALERL